MWNDMLARSAPGAAAGTQAVNQLSALLGPTGEYGKPINMANFQQSPEYQWSLDRTMKALAHSQAPAGNLSGNALDAQAKTAANFVLGQGNNWFNQQLAARQAQISPLLSVAGLGQSNIAGTNAAQQSYTNNVGNLGIDTATAYGGANLAGQTAYGNALTGAGNAFSAAINPNPVNKLLASFNSNQYGGA
jgi:hypothetical protein